MFDMCSELSREQLDYSILAQIMANIRMDGVGARSNRGTVERHRSNVAFYHHGLRICKATFLQLHGIGKYSIKHVHTSYLNNLQEIIDLKP